MNTPHPDSPEPLRLAIHNMSSLPSTSEYDLPLCIHAEEMKRVYTLVEGVKGGSEVRRIAEDFLSRSASRLHSLTPVIQPLIRPRRFKWRERQVSAWILGRAHLAPEQREFAVETLVQGMEGKLEMDTGEKLRQALLPSALLAAGVLVVCANADAQGGFASLIFMLNAARITVAGRLRFLEFKAEAANALGNIQAAEGLTVLVAATQERNLYCGRSLRRLQKSAANALPKVLARLDESHYGQVDTATMAGLCRLLATGNETLALAIIGAFAHIGNRTALAEVEKLAAGSGRAKKEARVQQAARVCLPILQARVARENDPHVLLRGSVVPMTPADQLLRPISDASPFDPLELLRSSVAPDWKGSEEDILLVVQVLNALQSNGDARALPYVEEILVTASIDSRILNAARACLPVLRAHQELEQYSPSSTLVSASESLTLRANA